MLCCSGIPECAFIIINKMTGKHKMTRNYMHKCIIKYWNINHCLQVLYICRLLGQTNSEAITFKYVRHIQLKCSWEIKPSLRLKSFVNIKIPIIQTNLHRTDWPPYPRVPTSKYVLIIGMFLYLQSPFKLSLLCCLNIWMPYINLSDNIYLSIILNILL